MSFAWFLVGGLLGAGSMYVAGKEGVWKPNPIVGPGVTADGYEYGDGGVITTPGKFEAEPRWAPTFWNMLLDGGADEELDDGIAVFILNKDDRDAFPELNGWYAVLLSERDDGFVDTRLVTEQELASMSNED